MPPAASPRGRAHQGAGEVHNSGLSVAVERARAAVAEDLFAPSGGPTEPVGGLGGFDDASSLRGGVGGPPRPPLRPARSLRRRSGPAVRDRTAFGKASDHPRLAGTPGGFAPAGNVALFAIRVKRWPRAQGAGDLVQAGRDAEADLQPAQFAEAVRDKSPKLVEIKLPRTGLFLRHRIRPRPRSSTPSSAARKASRPTCPQVFMSRPSDLFSGFFLAPRNGVSSKLHSGLPAT